jgi:hypothetical protein
MIFSWPELDCDRIFYYAVDGPGRQRGGIQPGKPLKLFKPVRIHAIRNPGIFIYLCFNHFHLHRLWAMSE